ncbi:retrovirus-related Pol polyprotein from transposon TNT 1-94, partial [Trifolium pratense]
PNLSDFDAIKTALHSKFCIKNLGQLKFFLGFEVDHSSKGIAVLQRKYCLDLLEDSGLTNSKPASTPLDPAVKLHLDDSSPLEDVGAYRRLVGRLLNLTTTRPDIAYATQQLSQFMSHPTENHHKAAFRVLRYMKQAPGRAEYRALAAATRELQWISFLIQDLAQTCVRQPVLYCDSQSAMHIAANPVFHERTKHLDIDCHIVRLKVQEGLMRLLLVPSAFQVADSFTKVPKPRSFYALVRKLGLVNIFNPPTCGEVTIEDE